MPNEYEKTTEKSVAEEEEARQGVSFCRWSSDNFASDLYCYETKGGYATHVAGLRIVGEVPKLLLFSVEGHEAWLAAHEKQMAFLETAKREPIGLPYDNQSFYDPDRASFVATIKMLLEAGYRAPEGLLEIIEEDAESN